MDLKATSSMLQLLPLDNTRRWLYFCTHHLPSDGDTETPSPAVLNPALPPKDGAKPSQTGLLPTFCVSLVAGFMSCHCVRCSTAFSMFFMIVDWCKREKTTVEGLRAWPVFDHLSWDEKWQNSKPKKKKKKLMKTKEKQVGKTREKVFTTVGVS